MKFSSHRILYVWARYFQWLIEDRDYNDPQLHTSYALSLAKSALECVEVQNGNQETDAGGKEARDCNVGSISLFESDVRERLQTFLQSSDLYDPEEILNLIEGSELWLEKVCGSNLFPSFYVCKQ